MFNTSSFTYHLHKYLVMIKNKQLIYTPLKIINYSVCLKIKVQTLYNMVKSFP